MIKIAEQHSEQDIYNYFPELRIETASVTSTPVTAKWKYPDW